MLAASVRSGAVVANSSALRGRGAGRERHRSCRGRTDHVRGAHLATAAGDLLPGRARQPRLAPPRSSAPRPSSAPRRPRPGTQSAFRPPARHRSTGGPPRAALPSQLRASASKWRSARRPAPGCLESSFAGILGDQVFFEEPFAKTIAVADANLPSGDAADLRNHLEDLRYHVALATEAERAAFDALRPKQWGVAHDGSSV
jgi:hypothetical protein